MLTSGERCGAQTSLFGPGNQPARELERAITPARHLRQTDRRIGASRRRKADLRKFRLGWISLKKAAFGAAGALIGNGRTAPQAMAGVADGMSLASLRKFWAVAARRNSSRAPRGPRSRSRSSFRMRLRWANSISTFFRSRLEVT